MSIKAGRKAASTRYWRDGLNEQIKSLLELDTNADGATLYDDLGEFLIKGIAGAYDDATKSPEAIENARKLCRETGNPFPLVALQWPSLVIRDEDEAAIFRKHLNPLRFSSVTDRVRRACLDESNPTLRLDWWQMIIIAAFFDDTISEIYIKGCTGAGKGGSTAIGINLWFDVFTESRTTLTSETYDHAIENIYGEAVKWRNAMAHPQPANVLKESISDNERHYIVVRNPAKGGGEAFSGKHGPGTLYVFDEATATSSILRENCEKNATKIVALANPRTLNSWFRTGFEPLGRASMDTIGVCYGSIGQRLCVTVGGPDCMNVAEGRLRKPVAPRGGITIDGVDYVQGTTLPPDAYKRVKQLIADQIDLNLFRANCAKDDSREVAIYAYGKFPDEDPSKQVVLSSWLPRHIEAWKACEGRINIEAFGLDVARSLLGDATVLSSGGRGGIRELHEFKIPDVVKIAHYVLTFASTRYTIDLRMRQHPVCIDYGGGYGSGVGDVLQSLGVWVIPFHPSGRAAFPEWFANLRTEAYGLLGRRLDPQNRFGADPFPLPPHPRLSEELTAPEKKYGADAIRFIIEPKDQIKEKLRGHSPDFADSATYLFHAIRILNDFDSLIRSLQRELVVWPVAETDRQKELAKVGPLPPDGDGEAEELPISLGLDLNAAGDASGGGSGTASGADVGGVGGIGGRRDAVEELLRFYREQYGGGNRD
jgi:hypothetical protein